MTAAATTALPTILDIPEARLPVRLAVENQRIRELFHTATRLQWNPATDIDWDELHPEQYSEAAARGRAHVLEPSRLERVRRDLGEPGAADPLLPRALPARHGVVLQHPLAGGIAARRGVLSHGRSARRLLRAAGRRGLPGLGRDARHPQDRARSGSLARRHHRGAGVRGGRNRLRRVPSHHRNRHQSGRAPDRPHDPARRDAALRLRLGVSGAAHAACSAPREKDVVRNAVVNIIEKVELNGYHSSWLAPDSPAARAEERVDDITWEAGLGATIEELEKPVFLRSVAAMRQRMHDDWGIDIPLFTHPKIADRSDRDHACSTLGTHAAEGRAPLPARPSQVSASRSGSSTRPPRSSAGHPKRTSRGIASTPRRTSRPFWLRRAAYGAARLDRIHRSHRDAGAGHSFLPRARPRSRSEVFPHRAQHRGGVAPRVLSSLRRSLRRLRRAARQSALGAVVQPQSVPRRARRGARHRRLRVRALRVRRRTGMRTDARMARQRARSRWRAPSWIAVSSTANVMPSSAGCTRSVARRCSTTRSAPRSCRRSSRTSRTWSSRATTA